MQETVKLRLLLTSALFLFVQIIPSQAQQTLDVAKITCKQDEEKVNQYCQGHRDTTVMDAVKIVLGFDK
jgi:hypothetical protein